VFGVKVEDLGAVPGGRVCAWNSGTASLPTLVPMACCAYVNTCFPTHYISNSERAVLTPPVIIGSAGGILLRNSPWLATDSGFADMFEIV
jgi:hypothetical protein